MTFRRRDSASRATASTSACLAGVHGVAGTTDVDDTDDVACPEIADGARPHGSTRGDCEGGARRRRSVRHGAMPARCRSCWCRRIPRPESGSRRSRRAPPGPSAADDPLRQSTVPAAVGDDEDVVPAVDHRVQTANEVVEYVDEAGGVAASISRYWVIREVGGVDSGRFRGSSAVATTRPPPHRAAGYLSPAIFASYTVARMRAYPDGSSSAPSAGGPAEARRVLSWSPRRVHEHLHLGAGLQSFEAVVDHVLERDRGHPPGGVVLAFGH